MARRCEPEDVAAIIEIDDEVDITPFIDAASVIVDGLETADTDDELSADSLKTIEAWVAAHCWAAHPKGQLYAEKRSNRASGKFQGKFDLGLNSTDYGQRAISMDPTGYLADLGKTRKRVEIIWGGTDYGTLE